MRLVLAGGNRDKATALGWWLGDAATIVLAGDLRRPVVSAAAADSAEEEGPSFAANAEAKASRASRELSGETIVATDGGLLVPALSAAWDPLRTRRFAGEGATNAERAAALLALAADLRGEERRIGWREALAVACDGAVLAVWEAEGVPGILADDVEPRLLAPGGGFWVPALWRCPEFALRRLAELSPAERRARDDHWARLGRQLRHHLQERAEAVASR